MTWLVVIVKFAVALWPKSTSAFTPGCTCDVTMLRLCRSFSVIEAKKQRVPVKAHTPLLEGGRRVSQRRIYVIARSTAHGWYFVMELNLCSSDDCCLCSCWCVVTVILD